MAGLRVGQAAFCFFHLVFFFLSIYTWCTDTGGDDSAHIMAFRRWVWFGVCTGTVVELVSMYSA